MCLGIWNTNIYSTYNRVWSDELRKIILICQEEKYIIPRPYSFRVGGPIKRFNAQLGKFYRKGEVIAAIDSRDFIIRKDEAEVVYRQAKAEFQRIGNLYEQDNISGSAYEKAKADHTRAKATYEIAENELKDTQLVTPFDGYVQEIKIEQHQEVKATVPVLSFIDLSRIKVSGKISHKVSFISPKP